MYPQQRIYINGIDPNLKQTKDFKGTVLSQNICVVSYTSKVTITTIKTAYFDYVRTTLVYKYEYFCIHKSMYKRKGWTSVRIKLAAMNDK